MISTGLTTSAMSLMISLLLLTGRDALSANHEVITDDGREVLLREDGTWMYRSNDRFADTKDGRRVRLKDDGSWQYVGNAPMTSDQHVRTPLLDIKLEKVVVEKHEKPVQKNVRVKTQTVFYLNLELSPLAKKDLSIGQIEPGLIKVRDNEGRNYPVLSVQPGTTTLKPGSETAIIIRVDGSPKWWGKVKTMEMRLNAGILGLQKAVTLSRNVADFDKKKVDSFD